MVFAWSVPAAVWLLVRFTAEACSRGTNPASKAPRGAAELCSQGTMTVTASPVQPGSSVTLSCQLKAPPQHCKVALFFNGSELTSNHSSSISTTVLVQSWGKHTFTCKIVCEHKKRLVCGIDVEAGNPPEEPRNVSCIQYGPGGHPTCSWEKGRFTYLDTDYVIELSNGTDVTCVSEEGQKKEVGSLALSKLDFNSTYSLVVAASNELGSASSQPLVFTLLDIVKPHPPNFSVEFENSSATSCTFLWADEAQAEHCRLRYRPLARSSWSMVESFSSQKCDLQGLEPHTAYEFQVSCKIHPRGGLWSNWGTFQAWTPEAVPTGLLDVWYRQQDLDPQRQNISVFWKALSKAEAGGRILRYTVTFEALDPRSPPAGAADVTTQTSHSRVVPRVDYKITVTAENSRGRSPPATIVTNLGTQDLPPPEKVSATPLGNSSIFISWSPPLGSPGSLRGYVVEWAETGGHRQQDPHPHWVKLPASNLSTVLAEHIKDNMCYQVGVFALYQDRAGQVASVRGYSRAEAPSAGPQLYMTPRGNGVVVSWEAVPAHQQRGCITAYHIYLQRKDGQGAPAVYTISKWSGQSSLYIPSLQPGEPYALWMTAVTAGGEGPRGNSEFLCLESAGDWMTVVLTCSFFILSACACSVPPVRKVLHSLLSTLVPQWQIKAIPDPANATWAKNYTSEMAELSLPCSLFLPSTGSLEEPETILVEETFVKTETRILGDKLLVDSIGRRGSTKWAADSSPGQEEPEYQAVPSMGDREVYEQQLPDFYKRLVEVPGSTQAVSEYITNPMADRTHTYLPLAARSPEEHPEPHSDALPHFPATFLTPVPSCGGNLTLDAVKINPLTR